MSVYSPLLPLKGRVPKAGWACWLSRWSGEVVGSLHLLQNKLCCLIQPFWIRRLMFWPACIWLYFLLYVLKLEEKERLIVLPLKLKYHPDDTFYQLLSSIDFYNAFSVGNLPSEASRRKRHCYRLPFLNLLRPQVHGSVCICTEVMMG